MFLYTELAGYIRNCLEALAESGVEVYVVAYPVNPEAPFEFSETSKANYFDRNSFDFQSLIEFCQSKNPDAIVCSGWVDADYIKVCKKLRKETQTVIAFDNHLLGGVKAKISAIRARAKYKSYFKLAWVPGKPQRLFALKMGFDRKDVKLGFYTADSARIGEKHWDDGLKEFPKRLVFVGRYLPFKGLEYLWEAFQKLSSKNWELYCIGTGDDFDNRVEAEGIHHLGFVQPTELDKFVQKGGVFVLPSLKEPWGVVVHEFTSAGYPVITTDRVGAVSAFVHPGENGWVVSSGSSEAIFKALSEMTELSDERLFEMGAKSRQFAMKLNVENWVATAIEIMGKNE